MRKIALLAASADAKEALAEALIVTFTTAQQPLSLSRMELPLDDASLKDHDLILLIGLEGDDAADLAKVGLDRHIRAALARTRADFQVLYGTPQAQCHAALMACHPLNVGINLQDPACDPRHGQVSTEPPGAARPWVWVCDKCSDPVCEHRLLSSLIARRAATESV